MKVVTRHKGPDYKELSRQARIKILGMIHRAGTSHAASNLSVIDLAVVIYENLKKGDEVVWSKGWAAASIYYFLAKQGKIPYEDLDRFAKEEDGKIEYLGLAETNVPGVWCAGGAVGHGLPVATGMALGKKLSGEDGIIHCIMTDGEMTEGATWEAVMVANHHKLSNLVAWIDANKWQAMGRTKDIIDLEPIEDRWKGFGWQTLRIDGHDYKELDKAMHVDRGSRPLVVICNNFKGQGVSFMEDHLLYHYKHVTKEEYERALKEL